MAAARIALCAALGGILLWAAPAFARHEGVSVCATPQELDPEVWMCGDDSWIADKGDECAEKIKATWKAASAQLVLQLQATAANADQNQSEVETKANYQKTIDTLSAQIKYMQDGTSLVASYVYVMINSPTHPLPCFTKAFDRMQTMVTDLDNEIIRAKNVQKMAVAMRDTSGSRHAMFAAASLAEVAIGQNTGKRSGASKEIASDVTGIHEDAAKRKSLNTDSPRPGVLAAPSSGGKGSKSGDSSVTRGSEKLIVRSSVSDEFRIPGLSDRLDPSGVFLARGSLQTGPENRTASIVRKANATGSDGEAGNSVGAALFNEAGGNLNVLVEKEHGAAVIATGESATSKESGSVILPTDSSGRITTESSLKGNGRTSDFADRSPDPALTRAMGDSSSGNARSSLIVASAESDLFHLVSSRYRATDLFRHAHVTAVPLGSFDPALKP